MGLPPVNVSLIEDSLLSIYYIFSYITRIIFKRNQADNEPNELTIPVPQAYFKFVSTENNKRALHMWSFVLPNEDSDQSLDTFLVPTTLVEKLAGIKLWERLVGKKIDRGKSKVRRM